MARYPAGTMTTLTASFEHCRRVTRDRARNFYYAFAALDAERRDAICSIYAFMRRCDDLSDDAGGSEAGLEAWRRDLDEALGGRIPGDPLWLAFAATAERYRIPHAYFHDMVDGVSSDLWRRSFASFDELYRYCYQVASVAGLSLIHVFGYRGEEALVLAEKCGVAFQLTNILRDVREDASNGRIYLPAEDLARFGVDAAALLDGRESGRFRELLAFEAKRARGYYDEARPLLKMVDVSCRGSLWALIEIYSRLLTRIERSGYDVMASRMRVPTAEKLWLLGRAVAGWTS